MGTRKTKKVPDEKVDFGGLLESFFDYFYAKSAEFYLELSLEAAPYVPSAKQQAELFARELRRVVYQIQLLERSLSKDSCFENKRLLKSAHDFINSFRKDVVNELKQAARGRNETASKQVFEVATAKMETLCENMTVLLAPLRGSLRPTKIPSAYKLVSIQQNRELQNYPLG